MRNKIWRPVNTYGLIFLGAISAFVLIYALILLAYGL